MKINWYADRCINEAEKVRKSALTKAALVVVREAKSSIGDTGIRGATKSERRKYRSKPGEPPHRDTGTLLRGIGYELVGNDTARVGVKKAVKYGYWLEYGTSKKDGTSKMAPRPFLRPALAKSRKKIVKIFKDVF